MFQAFEDKSDTERTPARFAALRREMAREGIDAYLVPHADEQQNEYLPACAERLAWLTGFTGSAGFAIVLAGRAVLFTDGRYTLQAARQTLPDLVERENLIDTPPAKWLEANARAGMRIGYDPWLLTIGQRREFSGAAEQCGAELVAIANLVDRVWTDRPAAPAGAIGLHPPLHAGRPAGEKLAGIATAVADRKADWFALTDTASLAWAFNLRGSDIPHIPVTLGFALIPAQGRPLLFLDSRKIGDARAGLEALAGIADPAAFADAIRSRAAGKRFLCDPATAPSAVADAVKAGGGEIVEGRDPCVAPRAAKNEAEIAGSRAAHLRDGVAVTRHLAWLSRQGPGTIDEIGAAQHLETTRADTAREMNSALREISFDTISGAGANGAIVHYRVNRATNAKLAARSLYLTDSGAQYADGTTDITRTLAVGKPPQGAAADFTAVLKGHIAIATLRFPAGTRGVDIDAFARRALWRQGKDYAHGTGHGVGSYLSVHEGPASISRRGMEPLVAGMILSNEPGYYVEGRYGIRIENLVLVREAAGYPGFLEFETLTLAPIDRALIDKALLDGAEIAWLDSYHARVREALSPHLRGKDREWLKAMCAPL
jgi:Xaa-Pro aminopeptidase